MVTQSLWMGLSVSRFKIRHLVLMGVSGCGKSTVGKELAVRTGIRYIDGDSLHPVENVGRMQRGLALTDADRRPWLDLCGTALGQGHKGIILGCSALRRTYRDVLRNKSGHQDLLFVHLTGDSALLHERLVSRQDHYMPPTLLKSQLDTLEPPDKDENTLTIGIELPIAKQVDAIIDRLLV